MRRMSFHITTAQIENRSKTVTRRLGWDFAKVGDRVLAVDRLRSKDARKLAIIEIVSVGWEPLNRITEADVIREGDPFPRPSYQNGPIDLPVKRFVERFCQAMKCEPSTAVNRIEFRYVDAEVTR